MPLGYFKELMLTFDICCCVMRIGWLVAFARVGGSVVKPILWMSYYHDFCGQSLCLAAAVVLM
ncbi:hypothetical protein RND71_034514 [Anisodus tanguticus]|uniref:Uncharacterized protein n=1 Tax=Anisodus tanguticus TaxID=243964 RepID=A0AAE1V532_9SOLA|nr:hypothetical protein RND71_034514 [Anisodus tanguticus]